MLVSLVGIGQLSRRDIYSSPEVRAFPTNAAASMCRNELICLCGTLLVLSRTTDMLNSKTHHLRAWKPAESLHKSGPEAASRSLLAERATHVVPGKSLAIEGLPVPIVSRRELSAHTAR